MKTKKTTVSKKAKPVRKKKKVVKKAKKTSIRKPKESFVYVDVRCVEATIFGIKAVSLLSKVVGIMSIKASPQHIIIFYYP